MKSFLGPLEVELEKRAEFNYKMWSHLREKLLERGGIRIDGDINQNWKYSVIDPDSDIDTEYPVVFTDLGMPLYRPFVFELFRRERIGEIPPSQDIITAATFYIAENGTVYQTGHPGEQDKVINSQEDGKTTYISSSKELTSDEVEGFYNDIKGLIP